MPMQPDLDPSGETLVQREGVNAGSEHSTAEASHGDARPSGQTSGTDTVSPPHGDAVGTALIDGGGGGATSRSTASGSDGAPGDAGAGLPDHAVASPQDGGHNGGHNGGQDGGQDGGHGDQQAEDGVLAGAPETTPPAPGQYGAESGQDSGSMA